MHKTLAPYFIAGLLGLGIPFAAFAQTPHPCPMPPAGLHAPVHAAMPPFLHGLKLSESQQDAIFEITHNAAPALREQAKTLKKAEEESQKLLLAEREDENAARIIAENIGRAVSEMHQLRLRIDRQILTLLTPEQRRQLRENPPKTKQHAELSSMQEKFAARQHAREPAQLMAWLLIENNDKSIIP